jgi:hypothetical protein
MKLVLTLYVNRLKDQYMQNWNSECLENRKLVFYRHFKCNSNFEKYLDCINMLKFKSSPASFRSSCHQLMIEKGHIA